MTDEDVKKRRNRLDHCGMDGSVAIGIAYELLDALEVSKRETEHHRINLGVAKEVAESLSRELERWRHGVTVEGDFVCPDSVALAEAMKRIAALEKVAAFAEHDFRCAWTSADRHCSCGLDKARKAAGL